MPPAEVCSYYVPTVNDTTGRILSAARAAGEVIPETALSGLADKVKTTFPLADDTLAKLTTWPSVLGMLHAVLDPRFPAYRPTCRADLGCHPVAAIFDEAMILAGDPRRAWRC
ncbi:hypothetical protein [Mangrovicoccus sp. HB161399]|uniref:hypothetical protein n=1 Tax=Mangrovicoccus sp. HB161399 TaxID=2720392 RepID=UPI0015550C3B|nr:hypothetical protein [Mangrovicoccus sp. HB161399]